MVGTSDHCTPSPAYLIMAIFLQVAHGVTFFKIEEPGTLSTTVTARLLINNTAVNKKFVVNCNRRGAQATTTLLIFGRDYINFRLAFD
jgi:hypothetical protein